MRSRLVPRLRRLVAIVAVAAALAVAPTGCGIFRELGLGGDDAKWAEKKYTDVSVAAVLQLLQTVVEGRYPPQSIDMNEGTFESGWIYGAYSEVTHQALRQRVLAETDVEDGIVTIFLRVKQETSQSAGRMALRDADDWEPADDDEFEAHRLLTRLHVLLRDVAKPVETPPAGG
jgi:hypothetical protein